MFARTESLKPIAPAPANDPARADINAEPRSVLPLLDYVSGDPAVVIAKLFVKSAQQARASNDICAQAEERAEDAADSRRIDAMKDRAQKNFAAGMVAGGAQMVSGALTAASGCASFESRPAKQLEGASSMTSGLGKIGETVFKGEADKADQNVVKAESEAKVHKRAADALRKESDAAAQHEGKVMQLLQEIKQTQAQCERAALLKMA